MLICIFAGFGLTQYLVNLHRSTEASLAKRWFQRGEEAMHANRPAIAADEYRTALSYDQENQEYRLRLAEALLAANRLNEARAHLLSLWEDEPADGKVNLALARLYVRRGNAGEAIRYYDNAINGVWEEEPRQQRIATRFELIRYLIGRHDQARARAETLALQADGPPDPAGQLALGQLLLQVNEPEHASDAFDAVLKADPANAQAWLGKGLTALALVQYSDAEHAFERAVQHDSKSDEARQQLDLVREVLHVDPALRGLSVAECSKRVAEAFKAALTRLQGCAAQPGYTLAVQPGATTQSLDRGVAAAATPAKSAPPVIAAPSGLQLLYTSGLQKQASATEAALRNNPDALEPTMQYVFEVERATAPVCPAMDLVDRALLTLAQRENENVK
ncbi:MAG: tetratricopeptide repeat protein [Candidatus Korobacteraceae bacterium]